MQKVLQEIHINKTTLHQFIEIPIFLFIMYCMFFCSVCIGGALQQFFDIISRTLFIDLPSWLLIKGSAPHWLQCIIIQGIGRGINVIVTFIPVVASMFFFLAVLENTGYITRAALIMNNFMYRLGLPGKSLIPMLLGFGCSVSAVLGTKILHNKQERILTIMMIPFISCGSKLAVYAIFVAAFFPTNGQNIVFVLYLVGILVAIFTGLIFKHPIAKEQNGPFTKKLSALQIPKLSIISTITIKYLKNFLYKIGAIIIPFCVILGTIENFKINTQESMLELVGKRLTPIFAPMGIQRDNWPAVVGLMSGVVSKEVIIGTLNTFYERENITTTQLGDNSSVSVIGDLQSSFQKAYLSIATNLLNLKHSLLHPFKIDFSHIKVNNAVLGTLGLKFHNSIAAFSYLLFILLYCPCISVLTIIGQELGIKWALFVMVWTTSLAYTIATAFYQIFTISDILVEILSGIGFIVFLIGVVYLIRFLILKRYFIYHDRLIPSKII